MKLLKEFSTLSEAEDTRRQFREQGVLTNIESDGTSQLYGIAGSAVKVGLWVVLNDQIADAEALLANPQHEVAYQLTEVQMQSLESQGKAQMASLVKYAGIGVTVLLVLVAALLWIFSS
tara:strand:+ start:100 stop:456 length:357 start_codon:yes stop_codon:yes gene_type:complete